MPNYTFVGVLFFLLFFYAVIPGCAQDTAKALNSDRPDRTQGPAVVPRGKIQIETGLQFQKDKTNNLSTKEYLYPEALVRIGIVKWAELRLSAEYKKEIHPESTNSLDNRMVSDIGFNNVQVGTKLNFFAGKGAIPAIGLQGNITLPYGSDAFRPVHVAPEGALLLSNKITDKLDLQYNVGYGNQPGQDGYQRQLFYAALVGLTLTDKLQGYGEFFAQKAKASPVENTVDMGLLVLLLPNLQYDIAVGASVSKAAPDYFIGTGITWRLLH